MIAYWEINIEFVYGTGNNQTLFKRERISVFAAMMCGIGKKESKLLSPILFETLIGGEDANSYGLSHKGYLYHGGPVRKYCETAKDREPLVIGVLFDGPRRELSYFVNGVYMGVAFYDLALDGAVFYPMISRYSYRISSLTLGVLSTSQKSQFVVSQQRCRYTIPSLTEKCLSLLVMRLHCSTKNHIKALGLPDQLSNLLYTRVQQYQGSTQKDTTSFAKELSCTKGEEAMEQEPSRIHQIFSPSSNEWDYGILSGLPPTIGENLMRILWARSTPSQF